MMHGSKKCYADACFMMAVVKSLLAVGISDAISTRYLKVRPNLEGGPLAHDWSLRRPTETPFGVSHLQLGIGQD